jgi:hypothetical protein
VETLRRDSSAAFPAALALSLAFLGCTAEVSRTDPVSGSGATPGAGAAAGAGGSRGGSAGSGSGASAGSGATSTGGGGGNATGGSSGATSTGGAATSPTTLQPGFTRLTRAEYRATIRAAFGIDPDLSLIPVDGRVGVFTSNVNVTPDPVHPYLLAGEDLAVRVVPAELPACGGSGVATCVTDNYRTPLETLFRRPLTDAELTARASMITELEAAGATPEGATRSMLSAALLNPDFLFRASPVAGDAARARRLAEHLSYALSDAPPDAALATVGDGPAAALGARLRTEAGRLAADSRATPVLARFVGQWLDVDTDLRLDAAGFATSPSYLELLALIEDALENDVPVTSLVSGDRGFVHQENLDAYGLSSIPENATVGAVTWPADSPRRGLLGEELFADANRHPDAGRRPIFRGKLVRTALLCDEIPAPSADLLALAGEVSDRTEDQRCRGCHLMLDPIGVAFAALDADFEGTPEPAQVIEHAELEGTYADLPTLLAAVAGSRSFADCFGRHFLAFFLEQPLNAVDAGFARELGDAVVAGASLRDVLEQAIVSLEARSRAATPWCEGP